MATEDVISLVKNGGLKRISEKKRSNAGERNQAGLFSC